MAEDQAAGNFWWRVAGLDPLEPLSVHPTPTQCVCCVAAMVSKEPGLLERRGPVGETVLAWCVLNEIQQNPLAERCRSVADWILREHPHLCVMRFRMSDSPDFLGLYDGENALHLAVVQRNLTRIRGLLDAAEGKYAVEQLTARAYGAFFSVGQISAESDLHGSAYHSYYGELPLSFAAALGYTDSAEELLKGLEQNEQLQLLMARDSIGNSAAHIAVLYGRLPMLKWLFQMQAEARDPSPTRTGEMLVPWRRNTCGPTYGRTSICTSTASDLPNGGRRRTEFGKEFGGIESHQESFTSDAPSVTARITPQASSNQEDAMDDSVKSQSFLTPRLDSNGVDIASYALLRQKNNLGLTPLGIAALIGNRNLFRAVVTTMRRVLWTFGDITCYTMPLTQIESDAETNPENETPFISILSLVVSEDLHDIASHELIVELLRIKWRGFGRACYCISLVIHIGRLCVGMWAAHTLAGELQGNMWAELGMLFVGVWGLGTLFFDYVLALSASGYRALVIKDTPTPPPPADDISDRIWKGIRAVQDKLLEDVTALSITTAHFPMSLHSQLLQASHILNLVQYICWVTGNVRTAKLVISIVLITQWTATVEYVTVHERLGVLGIIIDKVVRKDMSVYVFFVMLVIVGFAEALYVLGVKDEEDDSGEIYALMLQLYRVATGEKPGWGRKYSGEYPVLVFILYIMFSLYAFIVLLRLLICMFNRTEAEVQVRAMAEMRLRWARCVLKYERRLDVFLPSLTTRYRQKFYEFKALEPAVPTVRKAEDGPSGPGTDNLVRTNSFDKYKHAQMNNFQAPWETGLDRSADSMYPASPATGLFDINAFSRQVTQFMEEVRCMTDAGEVTTSSNSKSPPTGGGTPLRGISGNLGRARPTPTFTHSPRATSHDRRPSSRKTPGGLSPGGLDPVPELQNLAKSPSGKSENMAMGMYLSVHQTPGSDAALSPNPAGISPRIGPIGMLPPPMVGRSALQPKLKTPQDEHTPVFSGAAQTKSKTPEKEDLSPNAFSCQVPREEALLDREDTDERSRISPTSVGVNASMPTVDLEGDKRLPAFNPLDKKASKERVS
eukprot:Hpha_TRINITY_DN12386_c0_g1::TRINITY_DN12386_c0_g1_i1::g.156021::m.156021